MPLCAKCAKPFACRCSSVDRTPLGETAKPCPDEPRPGGIWVHVVDERGIDVKAVQASKDGTLQATDPNGVAVFDPVPQGDHIIDLVAGSVTALNLYEAPRTVPRKVAVVPNEITYVAYELLRKPKLQVKVVEKGNHAKVFAKAMVTVAGAATPPAAASAVSGISDFGLQTIGDYQIKVDLDADDQKTHATTLDFSKVHADLSLVAGQLGELIVEAEPLNLVTPKIELEYKIVILDRKLHDAQPAGETKVLPGATRIEVSVTQTQLGHPFTMTGAIDAPKADVFTDAACTLPLTVALTAKQLTAAKPHELWLRGKAEGLFELKLTLEPDPNDRFVKLAAEPAKAEMGVIKLDLQLHAQDLPTLKSPAMQVDPDTQPAATYYTNLIAKAMPPQIPMAAADKMGRALLTDASHPGRLLHVQDAGHFSRAKLVIAKINLAHLPAGTDDYDIVLKVGRGAAFDKGADVVKPEELQGGPRDVPNSGSIALFTGETGGAKNDNVQFKIGVLKNADQTLWVEGSAETQHACDLRLDLGLSRAKAGLAHTTKRNADWARFTVVKIVSVAVVDERQVGQTEPQRWDAAQNAFYVNLKPGLDGRKFKIAAKLSKPLQNIPLHILLAPSQNNRKTPNWGKNMPISWVWKDIDANLKHLDKADRKDFLHAAVPTDVNGLATAELRLSRFGGDKFTPGAYIDQDPILAKYAEGYPALETRKPVLGGQFAVSRKFWTQLIDAGTSTPAFASVTPNPGFAGAIAQYALVKSVMAAAPPLRVSPLPTAAMYPKSMIQKNGPATPGLMVSEFNKDAFFATVSPAADMPVKIPILICDAQWDDGDVMLPIDVPWAVPAGPIAIPNTRLLVKPYLDGSANVSAGTIECRASRVLPGWTKGPTVALSDADVDFTLNATGNASIVTVTLPASVQAFVNKNPTKAQVRIVGLTMKAASGPFLGESFGGNILSVFEPTDLVDFQNTIVHELGHFFGHTLKPAKVTTMSAAGIPPMLTYYESFLDIEDPNDARGSGPHCNTAAAGYVNGIGRQGYRDGKCVMYESGPIVGSYNRFCDVCHTYMLATDMAK